MPNIKAGDSAVFFFSPCRSSKIALGRKSLKELWEIPPDKSCLPLAQFRNEVTVEISSPDLVDGDVFKTHRVQGMQVFNPTYILDSSHV